MGHLQNYTDIQDQRHENYTVTTNGFPMQSSTTVLIAMLNGYDLANNKEELKRLGFDFKCTVISQNSFNCELVVYSGRVSNRKMNFKYVGADVVVYHQT